MSFKEWSREANVESAGPVAQMKGSRIGIDAEEYLNSLLTTAVTREPLLPALGGLPFALQKHIDEDLQSWQEAGISVWFVFNGLDIAAKDRNTVLKESEKNAKTLNEAWSIYDQGRGDDAVVAFGKACSYRTYHIVRWLQIYLHRTGINVTVAPYTAAAQLAWMDSERWIDAVMGSASCLVFGCDKVITQFDWDTKRLLWVELDGCLKHLYLKPEQFTDLLLLSGFSILPPFPEIDVEAASGKVSTALRLLSQAGQDGHSVCLRAKDDAYLAAFRKVKSAIKHKVIMTSDGTVEPTNSQNVPNDVHEFIGRRLPEEVYFYLSRGLIGPRVLNWRTRMEVFETQPLDGGSSQVYRELVQEKLKPSRAQALALATRLLHRYYQKTDVELVCWFKQDDKQTLGIPDLIAEASAAADSWHVKESTITNRNGIDVLTSPLLYGVNLLSDDATAKKTVTSRLEGSPSLLETPKELLANTVFRFLHDRGYVNPDHTLSGWGKAFKAALDHAQSDGYFTVANTMSEAEEAIFMTFELLRIDALNAKHLFPSPPYSGQPLRGSESDKAHTLLISRMSCLGIFGHASIGYTGPLSRHLLAYHQMTAAVRSTLRDLVEVHACNMLLSGAVYRKLPNDAYSDLAARLPFVREPDLGLALVVKSYLDELSNDADKRADITKWFNHANDIHGDLNKAWKMWAAVNAGVQAADSSIVSNETRKLFKSADDWLQQKLSSASSPTVTTNGTS